MIHVAASSLERIALCPGSYAAEKGLPSVPSKWAAEGDLLHAAMVDYPRYWDQLDSTQKQAIATCSAKGRELLDATFGTEPASEPVTAKREWKTEYRNRAGTVGVKIDFVAVRFGIALVIDWKFGRTVVDPAEENYQLMVYALAVAQEFHSELVKVAIVQPYADPEHRVTIRQYNDEGELLDADVQIEKILNTVVYPDSVLNPHGYSITAQRIIGEKQCRYCKALGTSRCPESAAIVPELAQITRADVMPGGAELAGLLEKAKIAEHVIERITQHARDEIVAGRPVPGWEVGHEIPMREIKDVAKAWVKVQEYLKPEQFLAACKIRIGEFEERCAEALNWKSGQETTREFNRLLGDAITREVRPWSLQRTKGGGPSLYRETSVEQPAPQQTSGEVGAGDPPELTAAIAQYRAGGKWDRLKMFGVLKKGLAKCLGDDAEYRRVILHSGEEDSKKLVERRGVEEQVRCFREVWLTLRANQEALAPPVGEQADGTMVVER